MNGAYLEVQTSTWEKDTHGLFDYETKSLKKSCFKVVNPSSIYRIDSECSIMSDGYREGSIPLIRIEQKSGEFSANLITEEAGEKMWLVVKHFKSSTGSGFKLREGDWIKLGRVRLRVQKLSVKPEKQSNPSIPEMFFRGIDNEEVEIKQETEENKENSPCRICLGDIGTSIDPLICPCKCAGTMKYVHLNCLKEWIKSKVSSRVTDKGMTVYIKDLSCELCSFQLPSFINYQNQQISLISLTFPVKSFVMFEEYRPDRMQRIGFHIITLEDGQGGSIGRGHDCDIKISDISVSRKHCRVRLSGSEFFIEDTKSKFGTLIKLSSQVSLKQHLDLTVQVNRTVFQFSHKVPFTFKSLCCCCQKSRISQDNNSYFTQPELHQTFSDGMSLRATMNPVHREVDAPDPDGEDDMGEDVE